jgi:hypothetical protein
LGDSSKNKSDWDELRKPRPFPAPVVVPGWSHDCSQQIAEASRVADRGSLTTELRN